MIYITHRAQIPPGIYQTNSQGFSDYTSLTSGLTPPTRADAKPVSGGLAFFTSQREARVFRVVWRLDTQNKYFYDCTNSDLYLQKVHLREKVRNHSEKKKTTHLLPYS